MPTENDPDLNPPVAASRFRRAVPFVIGIFALAGILSLVVLVQGWLDWWYDLPWPLRLLLLLLDAAELALLGRRFWWELSLLRAQDPHLEDVPLLGPFLLWATLGTTLTAAALTAVFVFRPVSGALLERMLLLNVAHPAKTVIIPITGDRIVATGSTVELSARAARIVPRQGRVVIVPDDAAQPPYARNVVPDKNGLCTALLANVQQKFRYHFQLGDSRSPEYVIDPQPPPALASLDCVEIFPAYTQLPPRNLPPDHLSLLMGSHLEIHARTARHVKSATLVLRGLDQTMDLPLDSTGTQLTANVPIPTQGLTGFSLRLLDDHGVPSANDTTYAIAPYPDQPPVVKWQGKKEETFTPLARPLLVFDASDDFALAKLTLHFLPAGLSPINLPVPIKASADHSSYNYLLDLSLQDPAWTPGLRVDSWIEATDNNGAGPATTISEHRPFVIVTPEQKEAEIRHRLAQIARALDLLSEAQADAALETVEMISHPTPGSSSDPGQQEAAIGQRVQQRQGDLEQILAEVQLNLLGTLDISPPTRTVAQLASLSQTALPQLTGLLQKTAADGPARPQLLAQAYQAQMDIALQLATSAADLSPSVAQARIVHHLLDLLVRQSANLRLTSLLPDVAGQPDALSAGTRTAAGIGQSTIESEIRLLAETLLIPSAGDPYDAAARTVDAGRETMKDMALLDSSHLATTATQAGPLSTASTRQAVVKESLLTLLQAVTAQADKSSLLAEARSQLDKSMTAQQALKDAILHAPRDEGPLADRENEIADRTSLAQTLLNDLDGPAAAEAGQARQDMEDISKKLQQGRSPAETVPLQDEITGHLAAARHLLQQQIDAAPAPAAGADKEDPDETDTPAP